jgi:hypothetical protein
LSKFVNYGQKCFRTISPYDKEDKNALKPFHIFKQKCKLIKRQLKLLAKTYVLLLAGNHYWRSKNIYLYIKTSFLDEEVNCTEPSPSVRIPRCRWEWHMMDSTVLAVTGLGDAISISITSLKLVMDRTAIGTVATVATVATVVSVATITTVATVATVSTVATVATVATVSTVPTEGTVAIVATVNEP